MSAMSWINRHLNRIGPEPEVRWARKGMLTREVHVICSPYKTGTTSVGRALIALGVGQSIMGHDGQLLQNLRPKLHRFNKLAIDAKSFNGFARDHGGEIRQSLGELVEALSPHDVFHDAPFGHEHIHVFVRKVIAPRARFIWINRNRKNWLRSVQAWEEAHPDTYPDHAEWKSDPEGRAEKRRQQWMFHYNQFKRLRRHDGAICLELDRVDLKNWVALAEFYDVPVPNKPFPRDNITRQPRF